MNILITGGNGTLGGYIVQELHRAGHSLTCFSRTSTDDADVRFFEGDINNPQQLLAACQGHDAVIHLAGVPGPGRASPADLLQVNVIGTVSCFRGGPADGHWPSRAGILGRCHRFFPFPAANSFLIIFPWTSNIPASHMMNTA